MIVLGIDPGLAERRSCVFAPGELEYTTKKSTTRRWLKNRRGRGKITPTGGGERHGDSVPGVHDPRRA
jgi:hypothetical protein